MGAGNVAGIVDETADVSAAADRIVRSKTFDNATSCSSENSLVIVDAVRPRMLAALKDRGAVMLAAAQKATLQALMWPQGKLSPAVIGQSARAICERAAALDGANREGWLAIASTDPRILMVAEDGVGHDHPFSGEKLSPVLAIYAARDFEEAAATVARIYASKARAIRSACTAPCQSARSSSAPSAGLARDRRPGALHRHRRQLRQRPALLALDGLRHLGQEQFLRQHELPALPQHHAHLAADTGARAERGRNLRRVLCAARCGLNMGLARTVHELIEHRAATQPSATYAVSAEDGRRIDYAELARGCRTVAAVLQRNGARQGDTVSIVMPNGLQTLRLLLGAMHAGLCVNPVNLVSQPEQMRYVLMHSDCRTVCVAPEWEARVRAMLEDIGREVAVLVVDPDAATLPGETDESDQAIQGTGTRSRRHRPADVHLRHHRPTQGRDADPGQSLGQCACHQP